LRAKSNSWVGAGLGRGGRLLVAFATASACAGGGVASAQDLSQQAPLPETTTATSAGDAVDAATGGGTTSSGGSTSTASSDSGGIVLKSEQAGPGRIFYNGKRKAIYHYVIDGTQSRDVTVQAVHKHNHKIARTWHQNNVDPGTEQTVKWGGNKQGGGAAPKGSYIFRVKDGGQLADRSKANGDRSVKAYPYKFPVRGKHSYGDGVGAPRAGHTHQGQDIIASCGTKLVANRGGKIQYRGYQASGAGYYLVLDGKGTKHDYVYMHMKKKGRPKHGTKVKTGVELGYVSDTGDASGCHLHFEEWSKPGWYEGGHFMAAVTKHLKRWDGWS
jgi:murein DD-endopeptidase MepM/ murein hydrolase activator NlpD